MKMSSAERLAARRAAKMAASPCLEHVVAAMRDTFIDRDGGEITEEKAAASERIILNHLESHLNTLFKDVLKFGVCVFPSDDLDAQ